MASSSQPPSSEFRSGYVALCGRPNVGKSTLLNALVGENLAVSSARPQTTRERMLGVWDTPRFQAVLVDTPGIHQAQSALNRHMVEEAIRGAQGVELILMLAEAPRLPDPETADQWEPGAGAMEALRKLEALEIPIALVVTKCDALLRSELLLPVVKKWKSLGNFTAIVPISAVRGQGIDELADLVWKSLPAGERVFEEDQLSDKEMRWHASEFIRGVVFDILRDEVPYSCAVVVKRYHEGKQSDRIEAEIHVERDSQKGILIGQGAKTIRAISMAAREKIAALTGRPCELFLDVRVTKDWTKDPAKLRDLGYVASEPRKKK